jgi:hypothetical protein
LWIRTRGVGLYLRSAESGLAGKQQINSSLKTNLLTLKKAVKRLLAS